MRQVSSSKNPMALPVQSTLLSKVGRKAYAVVKSRLFRILLAVLIAIAVCQLLPQAPVGGGEKLTMYELVIGTVGPLIAKFPSFMGWWFVQTPKGQFNPLFPTAEEILEEARVVMPIIEELKDKTFFRMFKVDLNKDCPFWARDDLCSSPTGSCAVCECTEDEVPLPWKQKPIEHFVDRKFFDREEVTPWLEPSFTGLAGAAGEAEEGFLAALSGTDDGGVSTYVDLSLNPPGFTDYKGRNIWGLIYKENCLPQSSDDDAAGCQEEDVFRKMISGLQTAIMVLASEYHAPFNYAVGLPLTAPSKLLPNRGAYQAPRHWYNLDLFRWRIAGQKEWIENLYLDFSLLLRTLAKVSGIVDSCPCYTGTAVEDRESRQELGRLLEQVSTLPSASEHRLAAPLFTRKQELALHQFTNISRIFDCVECEKCRLHGKVKLTALQVALKASGPGPLSVRSLERNEIAALINAIGYFADSVLIIEKFQKRLWALRQLCIVGPLAFFGSIYVLAWAYLKDKEAERRIEHHRGKNLATVSTSSTAETLSEKVHHVASPTHEKSAQLPRRRRVANPRTD